MISEIKPHQIEPFNLNKGSNHMKKRKMTFILRKDRTAVPSNREAKVTMWRMNKEFLFPEEIELWEKEHGEFIRFSEIKRSGEKYANSYVSITYNGESKLWSSRIKDEETQELIVEDIHTRTHKECLYQTIEAIPQIIEFYKKGQKTCNSVI